MPVFLSPRHDVAVNSKTQHPKEAALLLDFLFNDPFAVEAFGLQRGLPVSKAAVGTLEAKASRARWAGMATHRSHAAASRR